jgi:outer membrane autotransporter protein
VKTFRVRLVLIAALWLAAVCCLSPGNAQGIGTALSADFPGGSVTTIDATGAIQPAQLDLLKDPRVWSTVFAGQSSLDGDAMLGTQKVVASVVGLSFGADTQLDENTLVGASLGVSRQTFSSAGGNGNSKDQTIALYGRRTLFDHAYVSAALGLGLHDVATRRTSQLFGSILDAGYHTYDFGGRIEGGYVFNIDDKTLLSPYAAFVGDSYHQPAYGETASSGPGFLAAAFAEKMIDVTHMELGTRFGRPFELSNGKLLYLDALAAWEHELDDNPYINASFQAFPDTSFVVPGTRAARETALLGLGLRLQDSDRMTVGLRSDARVGAGTTVLSGTADVTYRW